jgi:hypothetical protein
MAKTKKDKVFSTIQNPRINYQSHGLKEDASYKYNLLVNMDGEVIVERIKQDITEIRYALKPEATTITDFFDIGNLPGHDYKLLYQLVQ